MITNQEAIEFLKNMIDREAIGFVCPEREGDVAIWQYHVEALQMAISALQAQKLSETQKALDTISRQKAIDATWFEPNYTDPLNVLTEVRDRLKALPSAQPEPSIPISWIEKQINWLKSRNNGFSNIDAMNISVLVKRWKKENGKDEGSD